MNPFNPSRAAHARLRTLAKLVPTTAPLFLALTACQPSSPEERDEPELLAPYEDHDEPVGAAGSPLLRDEPADPGQPGSACSIKSTTALASGTLYRPGHAAGGFCIPSIPFGGYPLLVFAHGDGYPEDDYDYLGNHLSSHGFLVVSTTFNSPMALVNALNEAMTAGIGANGKIALGGHSVGGESAVQAAKIVRDQGVYTVSAVVALAPADQSDYHLTADASPAFLVLYGSRDEDVSGDLVVPKATPPVALHGTSLSLWDRSGLPNDAANPLTTQRNYLRKHFIYVQEASHFAFTDPTPLAPTVPELGETPMADPHKVAHLAKSYVHAYLRWFLLNDSAQEGFFEGPKYTPNSVEAGGLEFRHAWMGKRGVVGFLHSRSRVIDDFERPGAFNVNTLGGTVSVTGLMTLEPCWQAPSYQAGGSPLYPCPHDTSVANIVLSGGGWATPQVTWTIPAASRDFRPFAHVGFRVALMYESMFNDGSPIALDVRLTDTGGQSRTISTQAYAEIPYPEHAWYASIFHGTGDFTKSQMVMVKIPLSAYSSGKYAVDLANVTEVRIQLPAGEAQIVLDDLELSF